MIVHQDDGSARGQQGRFEDLPWMDLSVIDSPAGHLLAIHDGVPGVQEEGIKPLPVAVLQV